jgi:hypothetical protein
MSWLSRIRPRMHWLINRNATISNRKQRRNQWEPMEWPPGGCTKQQQPQDTDGIRVTKSWRIEILI